MPINKKCKLIFIHIPKCGGVYITKLLDMYANNFLHSTNNSSIPNKDCHIYGRSIQHYTINMIQDCIHTYNIMNPLEKNININEYKIFTIIRNPYIRFISAYKQYPNRCNLLFKKMIDNKSLIEFAKYLVNRVKNEGYNFFNYGAFHQFQPSYFYIEDNNIKSNIIKLDDNNYNKNIKELCSEYGFLYNDIHLNTNPNNSDYNEYLNNKEFIKCINFIYKKDFELYNYDIISDFN